MSFWSSIGDFFLGTKDKNVPVYDKQQTQALNQLIQMMGQGPQSNPTYQGGQNWLNDIFGQNSRGIGALEQPYIDQFNQEILPGIANRFAGMGSGNLNSGAFQRALGGAGANLSTQLAALGTNARLQALPQALNYAQAPFQSAAQLGGVALARPNQQIQPGSPGFLAPILSGVSEGFSGGMGGGLAKLLLGALNRGSESNASTGLTSNSNLSQRYFNAYSGF